MTDLSPPNDREDSTAARTLRQWWREDRPVYWIHGRWEWGWLGNGWNRLTLGKVAIYFASGSASRLARSFGWLSDD